MSPADSVRLLPWFLSTAANPCAVSACSLGEVLTTAMQPGVKAWAVDTTSEFEGSHAPVSMGSLAHTASTLPPQVLPMSGIQASSTPGGL